MLSFYDPVLAQGLRSMSATAPVSPTRTRGPVQVQFQLGLFREEVQVPASHLSYGHAKRLAAQIIERKVTVGGVGGGATTLF